MTLKLSLTVLGLVLALAKVSLGGVLPYQDGSQEDYDNHHVSVASSFMHFRGPVEGPEFEVKVPYVVPHHNEHNHLVGQDQDEEQHTHGYTLDYVANPKYTYSYFVEDHHTGDFHGQKEERDGDSVSGEYSVQEPGGGFRRVTYKADEHGFHAVVHTSGKNDHSGATYTKQSRAHDHQEHSNLPSNEQENSHYQYYSQEDYS